MQRPTYGIYVPLDGVEHDVRPGSAIVGEERDGMVSTHIEGGGSSNVRTFEEKLHHAAGRRSERYPTSAIRGWRSGEVALVAHARYDEAMRHWIVSDVVDREAFADWLGGEPPAPGGTDALRAASAGHALSRMPASRQAVLIATHGGSRRSLVDAVLGERTTGIG